MHADWLVGFVTFLLVIATAALVITTVRISNTQDNLQKRANLIPLWEYISNLREIDPNSPAKASQILKTVNTLEFVALCKEWKIVEEKVILRTFREKYIVLFEAVKKCGEIEGYPRDRKVTGEELLRENNAACQLYDELIKERMNRDSPSS